MRGGVALAGFSIKSTFSTPCRPLHAVMPCPFTNTFAYYDWLIMAVSSRGPTFLIALLELLAGTKHSCFKLMLADLRWIHSIRGANYHMPDPSTTTEEALVFIQVDPKRWRKFVQRTRLATTSHFCFTTLGDDWSRKTLEFVINTVFLNSLPLCRSSSSPC